MLMLGGFIGFKMRRFILIGRGWRIAPAYF